MSSEKIGCPYPFHERGAGYKYCCGLGVGAVRAGNIGRDRPEARGTDGTSAGGGGKPWPPPHPRRNQRLMVPSGPDRRSGRGTSSLSPQTFVGRGLPPVTEGHGCPSRENRCKPTGFRERKNHDSRTPPEPSSRGGGGFLQVLIGFQFGGGKPPASGGKFGALDRV